MLGEGGRCGQEVLLPCAGLFLLACGYAVGARNAHGDGYTQIRWVGFWSSSHLVIATEGGVWVLDDEQWRPASELGVAEPPVPPSQVVAYSEGTWLVSESGEGFIHRGTWQSLGFIPKGPTPVKLESLGQLKARYR
jgi:hypothetical protein